MILALASVIFIIILGSHFRNKTKAPRHNIKKASTVNTQLGSAEKIAPLPEGLSDYALEGIVYDSESPLAVINGKIFKKQDKIDDWQVSDITPMSVELRNLKNNAVLSLKL